ncbi:proteasome assembly chaperone 1-like [Centruroides vittatus]|uniref:proteasome assembly chaperone 1-like n=1 Tax=Centruroides vittatus TaxID=120091 RepID=UPI00350FA49F
MATFFGEVLPVRSRAVDDEEEKDVPVERLYMEKQLGLQKCNLFVFSIGSNASTFNEIYVLPQDAQLLTHVRGETIIEDNQEEYMGLSYRKSSKLVGSLYRKGSVLFFICKERIRPEQAFPLAKQLIDSISSSCVLILCDYYFSEYKHNFTEILQIPFLRCLRTSKYNDKEVNFPLLRQPNTVSGLEAAILTECEVKNIPAELIVSYTDQCCLDVNCVKSFLKIFSIPHVRSNSLGPNPYADRQLKELFVNRLNFSDTLYI